MSPARKSDKSASSKKKSSKSVLEKDMVPISRDDIVAKALAAEEAIMKKELSKKAPAASKTPRKTREPKARKTQVQAQKVTASPPSNSKKLFVIDTNVILHDPTSIRRFEEHDLAIPITVLEEIDHFKRGSDLINFHAREVARELDELAAQGRLTKGKGVPLGENLGTVRVIIGNTRLPEVKESFIQDIPDHRILSSALSLQKENTNRTVVLVTKDVSLRLKARSLGVESEDYENDKIPDLKKLYTGKFERDHIPDELIDGLYTKPFSVPLLDFGFAPPEPNAYFVMRGGQKSALSRFDPYEETFMRVEKRTAYGIYPRNAEQTFAIDALTNPNIKLVTLTGKAGTGKTLLALAGALESRRSFHQIFLARPIVPLSNKDIGYLPGDVADKLDPYMQPLWDNLSVIRSSFQPNDPNVTAIQHMLENEKLTISPLAFIRGRSLNRIFFIVDEAQNLTSHEVKTIITRAGEGTKIVFTGDPEQIDSPYLDARSNGLTKLIDRMRGQELYAHITLERGERSELADIASKLL